MLGHETISCETAVDFLARLSPRSIHFAQAGANDWVFRGHAKAEWELQPSAFRDDSRLLPPPPQVPMPQSPSPPWDNWTNRDQILAEARTLLAFVDEADAAGLALPGELPAIRHELMNTFPLGYIARLGRGEVEWPPQYLWPTLAFAQHHGIATRFLDWTRSSYVAAYFAAVGTFDEQGASHLAVWAFSTMINATWQDGPERRRIADRKLVLVTAPYASNPNLRAQQGVHLALAIENPTSGAPAERDDLAKHVQMVHTYARKFGSDAAVKFTLPTSEASQLLWHLSKERVTAAQLFPGYAGAAKGALERKLRWPA